MLLFLKSILKICYCIGVGMEYHLKCIKYLMKIKNGERTLADNANFVAGIKRILSLARQKAYFAVNSAMVEAYWLIGKRIVEEEQQVKQRAAYGGEILKTLSAELSKEFGNGFGARNLWIFANFT